MKKFITYLILVIVAILLVYCCIPKSCEPSGKYEQLQRKSDRSLIIDSIQKELTLSLIFPNNAEIRRFEDSIRKIQIEKEIISSKYYALRASVSKQRTVRVDSFTQIVNVPIIEYNAGINSGNLCDSLLIYQDVELLIKDSIISVREIQIEALIKKVETGEIAKSDLLNLVEELKKELKNCKNQNKALKIGIVISILLNLLH